MALGHLLVMDSNKRAATSQQQSTSTAGTTEPRLGTYIVVMDSNKHDSYKSTSQDSNKRA